MSSGDDDVDDVDVVRILGALTDAAQVDEETNTVRFPRDDQVQALIRGINSLSLSSVVIDDTHDRGGEFTIMRRDDYVALVEALKKTLATAPPPPLPSSVVVESPE